MKRGESGWLMFVILMILVFGALVFAVVSGPKTKQASEVTVLAPFYQKGTFLIAVVRSDQKQRPQDIEFARKLVAAKYDPIDDSGYPVPFDAIIGMEKDGIAVTPGLFFCHGNYADVNLRVFRAKTSDEALVSIEAIARVQQKACASVVRSLGKAT